MSHFIPLFIRERFGKERQAFEKFKIFAAVFAGSFLLCMVALIMLPRKYESRMKLLVSNERQDLIITPKNDEKGGFNGSDLPETRLNSEMELLTSHDVLEQVVLRAGLAHEPGAVMASGRPSAMAVDRSIRSLERHLEVTPVKRSEIIVVSYRAGNPEQAKTVLSNLAETYLGSHLKAHATPGSWKFFDEQAKVYGDRLMKSEEELRRFRETHSMVADADQANALATRGIEARAALEDAQAQASDYEERVTKARVELNSLSPMVTSEVRSVPQATLVAQLTGMLAELNNKRSALAMKFRADDRFVTELDNEIAGTQKALESAKNNTLAEETRSLDQVRVETEKNLTEAEIALSGLQAKRMQLSKFVSTYRQQIAEIAGAQTDNESLVRRVKEDEENYLLYSRKREEARIAESLDQQRITNVSLIESPTFSEDPVFPQIPAGIGASILFSAILGWFAVKIKARYFNRPVLHVKMGPPPPAVAMA